jgi:hypothetical protein
VSFIVIVGYNKDVVLQMPVTVWAQQLKKRKGKTIPVTGCGGP